MCTDFLKKFLLVIWRCTVGLFTKNDLLFTPRVSFFKFTVLSIYFNFVLKLCFFGSILQSRTGYFWSLGIFAPINTARMDKFCFPNFLLGLPKFCHICSTVWGFLWLVLLSFNSLFIHLKSIYGLICHSGNSFTFSIDNYYNFLYYFYL